MALRWDDNTKSFAPLSGWASALLGAGVGVALTLLATNDPTPATAKVGGTEVPTDLVCEEDEVITFVGIDDLDCVHYKEVN